MCVCVWGGNTGGFPGVLVGGRVADGRPQPLNDPCRTDTKTGRTYYISNDAYAPTAVGLAAAVSSHTHTHTHTHPLYRSDRPMGVRLRLADRGRVVVGGGRYRRRTAGGGPPAPAGAIRAGSDLRSTAEWLVRRNCWPQGQRTQANTDALSHHSSRLRIAPAGQPFFWLSAYLTSDSPSEICHPPASFSCSAPGRNQRDGI